MGRGKREGRDPASKERLMQRQHVSLNVKKKKKKERKKERKKRVETEKKKKIFVTYVLCPRKCRINHFAAT